MRETRLQRACAILDDLIAFPTVSAQSNLALIDYVSTLLARCGIESTPVFNEDRSKANLVAVIGPKDQAGGVLLSGHTDVVPVTGQAWTSDPFRMVARDGKLYGRGACDMKGFIACVLAEAEAIAKTPLARPYQMVFSFDEEVGCVGVRRVIEQFSSLASLPALAIIGEPTCMNPVIGHKGKIAGRVTCLGHECHSSQAPEGLNAIHLATDMVDAMRAMQDRLFKASLRDEGFTVPVSTIHVGTIAGGTALNIVPRECHLDFEIRNIPADNADQLLNALFDEAAKLTHAAQSRFPESGVAIAIVNRYPGLLMAEHSDALTRVQRLAGSNRADKISFGTEGGLFHEALGIPTYVCGPGSIDQAHKPDEFIALDQMARCLSFLERLSAELAA